METLNDKINRFLQVSSGYGDGSGYGYGDGCGDGYGSGDGSGYGSGYGDGSGSGDGYGDGSGDGSGYGYGDGCGDGSGSGYGYGDGSGYGYGDGCGDGYGYGYGVTKFGAYNVYMIDGVATIIYNIRGNITKGAIFQKDMTLKPCYIAKEGDCFAHGYTIKAAVRDAHSKYMQNMPTENRIAMFIDAHPDYYELYSAQDLFEWHNALTGSCRFGREQFCKENGIDVDRDSFTIEQFVNLTCKSYGGSIILKLKDKYKK